MEKTTRTEEERARWRAWYAANKEKRRAAVRLWRKNNPEKARATAQRWQKANKEKVREGKHRWRKNNKEKVKAAGRRWRAANPEKARASAAAAYRRWRETNWLQVAQLELRSRAKGQPAASVSELRAKLSQQNDRCGLTGMTLNGVKPHLDHVVSVSQGGSHTIDNLHWTHPMANRAKGAHSVAEFESWLFAAARSLENRKKAEALL